MPRFEVALDQAYLITIEAADREDAKKFAEFFIVGQDGSTNEDRREFRFRFEDTEMVINDASECEEVPEGT